VRENLTAVCTTLEQSLITDARRNAAAAMSKPKQIRASPNEMKEKCG